MDLENNKNRAEPVTHGRLSRRAQSAVCAGILLLLTACVFHLVASLHYPTTSTESSFSRPNLHPTSNVTSARDPWKNDDIFVSLRGVFFWTSRNHQNVKASATCDHAGRAVPEKRGTWDSIERVRPASDDEYKKAEIKGQKLLAFLNSAGTAPRTYDDEGYDDKGHDESLWESYDQLKEWVWVDNSKSNPNGEMDEGLRRLAKPDPKTNWIFSIKHDKAGPGQAAGKTGQPGMSHPPTGTTYENRIYPRQGLIVSSENWGNQADKIKSLVSQGKWDPKTQGVRPLRLCDAIWLGWLKYSTSQRSNLRLLASQHVKNVPTVKILAKILMKAFPNEELPAKGVAPEYHYAKTFTPEMDGFAALIGSQGIYSKPLMLAQRAGKLGLGKYLTVEKIVVWCPALGPSNQDPNFLLYLKEV